MTMPPTIKVTIGRGVAYPILAVVAEDVVNGLAGIDIPPDGGMWFMMETIGPDADWIFHMKGMEYSIDVLFVDYEFRVIGINRDVQPEDGPFCCGKPSRYVLEVRAGWCRAHDVITGCQVRFG